VRTAVVSALEAARHACSATPRPLRLLLADGCGRRRLSAVSRCDDCDMMASYHLAPTLSCPPKFERLALQLHVDFEWPDG
jgi:hypothetical protein